MGEDFAQGMNSPPRMNENIRFSTTSSSSFSTDDASQHGLTPPIVEIFEPMIQDKSTPPSPQSDTVPSTPTPIMNVAFHQDN